MRRPLAGLAAIAVLVAGVGTASAGTGAAPTFFTKFALDGSKFSGKITSSKSKCEKSRKIVLYRKKNGDKKKLGSDKTNDKGKFKIGVGNNPKNGKYFAQAKETNKCQGEKSAKVELS